MKIEIKTKREAEIVRAAFVAGAVWQDGDGLEVDFDRVAADALVRYPDPVRPREIRIGDGIYRVVDGKFQLFAGDDWILSTYDPDHIKTLADLLNSPTEPVPEGDSNV